MPPDDLPPWIQQHRWAVGQRLRTLRLDKGLTQMQLGARAGIDNKTISRIENGRYPTSIDQIARLARALDVPSFRLFHDCDP
ncbi:MULTISPECIES: helix-turn-helix domain-containing protein [Streptomyces]|uniref:Helix-turn-helix transcriptional regulator n=1 Tax=Streptomyces rhizosphaericus TaxID=114699 RepID=A0A6G4AJX3_9ACTN|nr:MULTISPECIES: helix-turn-helix transcriptional regulator [Streptomyces]NEW73540.1 helix-turn-helix transcriptional regulator [Streptomyces rhizosphaericus]TMU94908.1 helix-turn-helix transcriptional regulator [Streptomyces sp. DASNCL29]